MKKIEFWTQVCRVNIVTSTACK